MHGAHVPIVPGQVYLIRNPFSHFDTIGKSAGTHDMFYAVGKPLVASNYRYLVDRGDAVLVAGPGAPKVDDLPPEVAAFVRDNLAAFMNGPFAPRSETPAPSLCSTDDIERALRAAIPDADLYYVDAIGPEVRAYAALPGAERLAIESAIAARIVGPFHVAVLSADAQVSRVRGEITTMLDKIRASGAPPFVVRAWTAALCGLGEARGGRMFTPSALARAYEHCHALATRLDQARNGLRRPVPAVRAAVLAEVTATYGGPCAMCNRFMAAYNAG